LSHAATRCNRIHCLSVLVLETGPYGGRHACALTRLRGTPPSVNCAYLEKSLQYFLASAVLRMKPQIRTVQQEAINPTNKINVASYLHGSNVVIISSEVSERGTIKHLQVHTLPSSLSNSVSHEELSSHHSFMCGSSAITRGSRQLRRTKATGPQCRCSRIFSTSARGPRDADVHGHYIGGETESPRSAVDAMAIACHPPPRKKSKFMGKKAIDAYPPSAIVCAVP
jgi:hypothetical protein